MGLVGLVGAMVRAPTNRLLPLPLLPNVIPHFSSHPASRLHRLGLSRLFFFSFVCALTMRFLQLPWSLSPSWGPGTLRFYEFPPVLSLKPFGPLSRLRLHTMNLSIQWSFCLQAPVYASDVSFLPSPFPVPILPSRYPRSRCWGALLGTTPCRRGAQ